jgi:hypothetical protein
VTRRRLAATIVLGVLLGFFAGVAAMSLGRDARATLPTADAGASGPSASLIASAGYGRLQAKTHLALIKRAPVVPFIRTLSKGDHGPDVKYLQRALVREGVRPKKAKATGFYGQITGVQVEAFQIRVKIKPRSGVYGPRTHHQLAPYYDLASRRALQAIQHAKTQAAFFNRISSAASVAWKHRTSMAYSQSGSRAFLPLLPNYPRATDCSGYATWLYKVSGLPDPSGFQYRIIGYTGTLAQHGTRISANAAFHIGDLVFYGGGYPYGHVAIVVDAFRRLVSSHGSPGIKVVPFNYRPVSAVRRYF